MSNISKAFDHGKAFIGFATAGDPDLETSRRVMLEMARGGCDLIEIGIPFSDPIAEGPVIQEADLRALNAGTTTDKVFEMTADWETKLLRIERGEMEPETFMTEIKEMISSLVTTTEAAKGANALMKNKIIGVCPNCGANVVEREKGWFCESNPCRFELWKDNAFLKRLGKRMDAHVADKLLRDGRVRLKDCKSAKGKTYNATVLLGTEADGRSKFSLEFEGGC